MQTFTKNLSTAIAAFTLSISLTACGPKTKPVKPTAEQQTSLEQLHKSCLVTSAHGHVRVKGSLPHLAKLRKRQHYFSCGEITELCGIDYENEMCKSMIIVASVENAFEKACRKSKAASRSAACTRVSRACNVKGFDSPECISAVARYNK